MINIDRGSKPFLWNASRIVALPSHFRQETGNPDSLANTLLGTLHIHVGMRRTHLEYAECGHVVSSVFLLWGGREIDLALRNFLRSEFHLVISQGTTSKLKCDITRRDQLMIQGVDENTREPRQVMLSGNVLCQAITPELTVAADAVRRMCKRFPAITRIALSDVTADFSFLTNYLMSECRLPVFAERVPEFILSDRMEEEK